MEYYSSYEFTYPNISLASFSAVSLIIHCICFRTRNLHPLVVITFGCEFLVAWFVVTVFFGIGLADKARNGCAKMDTNSYYSSNEAKYIKRMLMAIVALFLAQARERLSSNRAIMLSTSMYLASFESKYWVEFDE